MIRAKKQENNRVGKIRDLFKKIKDTKGTFHAKMGSIKDRNGMDQTEAEDIIHTHLPNVHSLSPSLLLHPDLHLHQDTFQTTVMPTGTLSWELREIEQWLLPHLPEVRNGGR